MMCHNEITHLTQLYTCSISLKLVRFAHTFERYVVCTVRAIVYIKSKHSSLYLRATIQSTQLHQVYYQSPLPSSVVLPTCSLVKAVADTRRGHYTQSII
jgi:hypothetical protein